jgi:hypothetical protein
MNKGAITIYPKKEQNSDDTKRDIQNIIKPRDIKVGISAVRKIRNGGILVETDTKEEESMLMDTLMKNKKLDEGYEVGKPKKRKPQIIIYGVDEQYEPKELIELLIEQNEEVEEGQLTFRTRFKARRGFNVVLDIEGKALNSFSRKRLKLGWVSYSFKEYFKPVLCFKCGIYGHIAKFCGNKEVCLNCGEEGHQKKDCNKESKCINCVLSNSKYKTKYNITHSCTSKDCLIHEKEVERIIARTDYG